MLCHPHFSYVLNLLDSKKGSSYIKDFNSELEGKDEQARYPCVIHEVKEGSFTSPH